jgi:hypothetical protein
MSLKEKAYNMDNTTKTYIKREVEKENEKLKQTMTFVEIVLFIGFSAAFLTIGGFLQSYLATKAATYQILADKVNEQNTKIDSLTTGLITTNATVIQTNSDIIKIKTYFGIK